MNLPEKSKINITQLWPCPGPSEPGSQRFMPEKSGNPFLPAPVRHIFAKSESNVKTHPKSKTNIFWKQGSEKSDTFLDTSKTTKPRDIHIQVRRTLLYRVPRNNSMFHNKIQPPMERFHRFSFPNPKI